MISVSDFLMSCTSKQYRPLTLEVEGKAVKRVVKSPGSERPSMKRMRTGRRALSYFLHDMNVSWFIISRAYRDKEDSNQRSFRLKQSVKFNGDSEFLDM